MTDSRAAEVIRDQERMSSDRAQWETLWEDVARRVLPRMAEIPNRSWRTPAQRRDELMFDSTAPLALETFAAAMESISCPRSQKWHGLKASDDALNEVPAVRRYLEALRDQLFRMRYAPEANFASQMSECFMSLGAFGTSSLFVDDVLGRGARYRAIDIVELYIAENAVGSIDKVHRRFRYTARQAVQAYGDELPQEIKDRAEKEPNFEFEFIHCVKPNAERKPGTRGYRGMPFISYHVSITGQKILREGGYRRIPYCTARYSTLPGEVYGRSPAINVLASIKMANEMMRTTIVGAQLAASPPFLLPNDDTIRAFQFRPGALNYGGVSERGEQLVHPLQTGADFQVAFEAMQQTRETINRAFLVTLFQILVENPQMTATEALIRAQEKGVLLTPAEGRIQSEKLGPAIERELDILEQAGAIPEAPEELQGQSIEIQYDTPLTRAQSGGDAIALARTLEGIAPFAAINPEVLQRFDTDEVINMLERVHGLPAKVLRTVEQMAELQQAAQQQQMLQMAAQAGPLVATTAKDMAQAGKFSAEARSIQ